MFSRRSRALFRRSFRRRRSSNSIRKRWLNAPLHVHVKLDSANVPYFHRTGAGEPPHVIVDYAKENGCYQIIMGTRELGTLTGLLLGSVATKAVYLSEAPVELV